MKDLKFIWLWCDSCNVPTVVCPRCGNNLCNGARGPSELNSVHDSDFGCPICPLARQHENLADSALILPKKEQCVLSIDIVAIRANWIKMFGSMVG